MNPGISFLAVILGYLVGSVSFTRIMMAIFAPGRPISKVEVAVEGTDKTYNVTAMGASTASMVLGRKAGCLIGWLDILKGTVPTLVARLLYPDQPYYLLVALACMVGHNWPIYYRFKGGRGISVFYGGLLVIDWLGVIVTALGGFLLGFFILRNYLLIFLAGLWLLIPWMWLRTHDWSYLAYAIAVNVLFVLASIPDIQQYRRVQKEVTITPEMVMETNPMGRGMLRIGRKLGIYKEAPAASEQEQD
jgi:glycerol-3-phosphate acyltransferase PlsY